MSLTEVQCCVSVSHLCRCSSSSSGRGPIHSNGRLSSFLLTHTSYTHTQPQTHLPPVRPTRSLTSSSACSWAECEFQEFRVLTAQIQQRERVLVMWEEEMGEEHILCLSLSDKVVQFLPLPPLPTRFGSKEYESLLII